MTLKDKLLSFFFPPFCVLCGQPEKRDGLCEDCLKAYAAETFLKCPCCGKTADRCSCGDASDSLPPFGPDGRPVFVLTWYVPDNRRGAGEDRRVTDSMILRLKERGEFSGFFAGELAREIGRQFEKAGEDPRGWTVAWCPRSPEKFKESGFDQGEEIARRLAKLLGIRAVSLLERGDLSEEQKSLGTQERKRNAETSLRVRQKKMKPGMRVLLLDDILTTGATLKTSVSLLLESGAEKVYPAVIAKTLPKKRDSGRNVTKST